MAHTQQIKAGLGISGVLSNIYSWRKEADENGNGAQIDLLIDRNDQVINVCEMKYSMSEFTIDADYERELRNKKECIYRDYKNTQGGTSYNGNNLRSPSELAFRSCTKRDNIGGFVWVSYSR